MGLDFEELPPAETLYFGTETQKSLVDDVIYFSAF